MGDNPIVMCCGRFSQEKEVTDPDIRQQIEAIDNKFDEACNNNDAAAVAALFTQGAVDVTPTGVFSGRQTIEKYFEGIFQQWHVSNHDLPAGKPMAGLDDQVTYCPALVVHYKVIDVADRSVAGLNLIAAKVAVAAKSLRASQMGIAVTVEVATPARSHSVLGRSFRPGSASLLRALETAVTDFSAPDNFRSPAS